MTNMTRDELVANLKQKLGVSEPAGGGVDLLGAGYALAVVMEPEELTDEVVRRLQEAKGKKGLKRMVAVPPKATVINTARERLQGTGIGVIDGRGFIVKPYSPDRYRSVTLGTMK
jgi:hypothetical protein